MEGILVWGIVIIGLIIRIMKFGKNNKPAGSTVTSKDSGYVKQKDTYRGTSAKYETSAMPHKHRESGVYDSANKHRADNSDGAMPHSHKETKYKHIDVSTLPKGYILLNGEPVRTADLEKY